MSAETAALALSAGSLLVSLGVAWKQHQLALRTAAIEEARRKEEIETKKTADLVTFFEQERYSTASFGQPQTATTTYFVVKNVGAAPARYITVSVERDDPPDYDDGYNLTKTPLSYLDPGQDIRNHVFVYAGKENRCLVTLRWTDDRGPQQKTVPIRPPGW